MPLKRVHVVEMRHKDDRATNDNHGGISYFFRRTAVILPPATALVCMRDDCMVQVCVCVEAPSGAVAGMSYTSAEPSLIYRRTVNGGNHRTASAVDTVRSKEPYLREGAGMRGYNPLPKLEPR